MKIRRKKLKSLNFYKTIRPIINKALSIMTNKTIPINKSKNNYKHLLIKSSPNCKNNQDSKNSMKIIKLFKPKNNTFAKKVYNKSHSNLKSIVSPKKSSKPKEILLQIPSVKNIKLSLIPEKVLTDIKVHVKNQPKETLFNYSIKPTIKILQNSQEKEKVSTCPETFKDSKLESIFTNKQ